MGISAALLDSARSTVYTIKYLHVHWFLFGVSSATRWRSVLVHIVHILVARNGHIVVGYVVDATDILVILLLARYKS